MGQGETSRISVPPIGRTALWFVAFVISSVAVRDPSMMANGVPVVGPAIGVALLWLASSDNWWRDGPVLLAASAVLGAVNGDDPWLALVGPVAILAVFATVLGLRRWAPDMWGGGGREPMGTLTQFALLLLLAAVSSAVLVTARVGLGVLLVEGESWSQLPLRISRSFTSIVALGTVGLLVGGRLVQRADQGVPLVRATTTRTLELLAISALSAAIFVVGFVQHPAVPTTFMLGLAAVWVAVRFGPATTSIVTVALGILAMALTMNGYGPVAVITDPAEQAVMAQAFLLALLVIGMAVSLTRRQLFETITRLQRSEDRLSQRAAELDLMLDHLNDGVAIVEEGGRIVHANPALGRLLTGPGERFQGVDRIRPAATYRLFHPDGRPLTDEEMPHLRALRGETVTDEEYHLRAPSLPGGRVLSISAVALPTAPGQPARSMTTLRDVTAESEHRDALADFAGTVAHDLNNPLSVVGGWAESLEEAFRTNDQVPATTGAPMVSHIQAATERMREFISDLLAHTVARDQSLQCERVELRNVVKDLEDTRLGPGSVHHEIETGELPDVWADRSLVVQLLDNLLGNAFKYVAPGTEPQIRITAEESDGWATVRMIDNGIGIPEDQRQRIFETFHRAGRLGYDGHGLGLSICKRIVERHGGTISVSDNPEGQGSCFTFTLPTTAEALAAATERRES